MDLKELVCLPTVSSFINSPEPYKSPSVESKLCNIACNIFIVMFHSRGISICAFRYALCDHVPRLMFLGVFHGQNCIAWAANLDIFVYSLFCCSV